MGHGLSRSRPAISAGLAIAQFLKTTNPAENRTFSDTHPKITAGDNSTT
jgi:hypothetical protein